MPKVRRKEHKKNIDCREEKRVALLLQITELTYTTTHHTYPRQATTMVEQSTRYIQGSSGPCHHVKPWRKATFCEVEFLREGERREKVSLASWVSSTKRSSFHGTTKKLELCRSVSWVWVLFTLAFRFLVLYAACLHPFFIAIVLKSCIEEKTKTFLVL